MKIGQIFWQTQSLNTIWRKATVSKSHGTYHIQMPIYNEKRSEYVQTTIRKNRAASLSVSQVNSNTGASFPPSSSSL